MAKTKSSSFAPNALKHYGGKTEFGGGTTAKISRVQGKISTSSSMNKGKEIYGGHTISREINKGNFKHGKK